MTKTLHRAGRLAMNRRAFLQALAATGFAGVLARAVAADKPWVPLFDFAIAGGHYHGLYEALPALRLGDALVLRREPANPHDGKAIVVQRPDGLKLGYVPRAANPLPAGLADNGWQLRALLVAWVPPDPDEEVLEALCFTGFRGGDPILRLAVREGAA